MGKKKKKPEVPQNREVTNEMIQQQIQVVNTRVSTVNFAVGDLLKDMTILSRLYAAKIEFLQKKIEDLEKKIAELKESLKKK